MNIEGVKTVDVKPKKTIQKKVISPKTKKIYEYGDKYKGKYAATSHKIYLRKKEAMTPEQKQANIEYKKNYYLNNKPKYKERTKKGNERIKKGLKLLKEMEQKQKVEFV